MSRPDETGETSDVSRRRRQRTKSLLLVLAGGLLVFAVAAGGLYYALQPTILRIAVGPPDSDDQKLVQAIAQTFAHDRDHVRLVPIAANGAVESLALLGAGKADLAVARGDLEMPAVAETVAIVRKNFVVLWSAPAPAAKGSKRQGAVKIKTIDDLAGHRVGIIGKTQANVALLRLILTESGVAADKVAVTQFGVGEIDKLAADPTLDAFLAVGPLDSKITAEALAATARSRGEPKFLPIDVSEAIAQKHPLYESEEIPGSIFNSKPAWPDDKIETISVNHLIVARKTLSETTVAALARQLFAIRQSLAAQLPSAPHLKKPDTDKDAELPVHRGAAAYLEGTERTFLDRYSDYFWFAILVFSGLGSVGAWLNHFLKRDETEQDTIDRDKIFAIIAKVREAETPEQLLAMQREVDAILRETLGAYDDGAIEEEDLSAVGLVLEQFHHAVIDRRAAMGLSAPEPARMRSR
jgi:TRAP transporter TAXI family solute receptor